MRLPLFVTTLLLGSLQAFPLQALSYDLSELNHQNHQADIEVSSSDAAMRAWVAGRPHPSQTQNSRNQSRSGSKSRSQSRRPPARAQTTTHQSQPQRRSQPSTTRRVQPVKPQPRPKSAVRRSQPKAVQLQRRTRPKTRPTAIQSQPRPSQPKAKSPNSAMTRKTPVNPSSRISKPGVKQRGLRKRPQPQTPSNSKLRKIRKAPAQTSAPKVATPTKIKKQQIAAPAIQKKRLTSSPPRQQQNSRPVTQPVRQNRVPKPAAPKALKPKNNQPPQKAVQGINKTNGKPKPPSAKRQIKPAVAVKKVRNRGAIQPAKRQLAPNTQVNVNRHNVNRRKDPRAQQRRALRRRRDKTTNRYWGNRRVQTRRLTRSYRPCYYCPGRGWSYSPTCYTRPSRYYIFSDSLSYWPNHTWSSTTRLSRRSNESYSTQPSLNQQLQEQVEIAIRDYAELYNLAVLNDDIDVSQEGSIIILTGVVDQEETLEDLIAIARDIDGVKYVITDDVIVRELQGEGLFEEESLTFDSAPSIENGGLDENLAPSIPNGGLVEGLDSSRDTFPPILRQELLEDQLEASLPDLEMIAAATEFLPSAE